MTTPSEKDPSLRIEEVAEDDSQAMTRADPSLPHASPQPSIVAPVAPPAPAKSALPTRKDRPLSLADDLRAPQIEAHRPSPPAGPIPARAMSAVPSKPDEAIPVGDPAVGTLLAGRYRIEKLIAKGGMGRVYLATQLPLERRVAIKLLSPRTDTVSDPQFVRRFFLEAAICARLSHPNIVTVHDYGEAEGGLVFMAMEYLDGTPLSSVIKEQGGLPPDRTLAIGIQICRGLREAHARGIVHRDLKPGNIMLLRGRDEDNADIVKVLDFGLVKVFEAEGESPLVSADLGESFDLTRAGILLGSPRYMSPEQIRNDQLDQRTDVYSLGVILYQMVAGKTPFNGKTSVDILHQHLHQAPPPIEGLVPELGNVIYKCMSKAREDRYASINDLLRELKHVYKVLASSSTLSLGYAPPRLTSGSSGGVTGSMSVSRSEALESSNRSNELAQGHDLSGSLSSSARHSSIAAASAPLAEPMSTSDSIPQPSISGSGSQPIAAATPAVVLEESTSDQMLAARAAAQESAPARSNTRRVIIGGVLAAVIAGTAGALIALSRKEPAQEVKRDVPANPPKRAATLLIESRPTGASVSEGGRVLGKTPLALPLDPDETNPRDFEISLTGYASHSFRQAPQSKDTRVVAELVPVPVEPPVPVAVPDEPRRDAKVKKAGKVKQSATKTQQTTTEPAEPDIRLQR